MQSIEYRYTHDPLIRALVDSLHEHIKTLKLTPSEIRECAMLASIHYEQNRARSYLINQERRSIDD